MHGPTSVLGVLTAQYRLQSGPSGRANKPRSKIQKQGKKERLRQKRKRVAAAAAAVGSTEDAETLRERNLRYYVETAKADANVQKLMREVWPRLSTRPIPPHQHQSLPVSHRPSFVRRMQRKLMLVSPVVVPSELHGDCCACHCPHVLNASSTRAVGWPSRLQWRWSGSAWLLILPQFSDHRCTVSSNCCALRAESVFRRSCWARSGRLPKDRRRQMRTSRICSGERVAQADRMPLAGRCGGSSADQGRGTAAAPAAFGSQRQTVAADSAERAGTMAARNCSPARSGCGSRPQRRLTFASIAEPCMFSRGTEHSGLRGNRCRLGVQAVSGTAAGGADGGQHLLSMLGQLMAGMQRHRQAAPTGSHLAVRGVSFQPAGADAMVQDPVRGLL